MPDVFDRLPSNTIRPSLTTLRRVEVKVAMHPSLHIFPIDTRSTDCRWGKMCTVLAALVRRRFYI